MRTPLDEPTLAEVLPGVWSVAATNLPLWLVGDRVSPTLTWEVDSTDPLVLADDLAWTVRGATGPETVAHNLARNRFTAGYFVRRVRRAWGRRPGRWSVIAVDDAGAVAVIRLERSFARVAGVDILTREGARVAGLRATVARSTEDFELTPEEFASLTWLHDGSAP